MRRLAAAASLACFAAVSARAALGPRYGGELTVAVVGLPEPLAPTSAAGLTERTLGALVHETLVHLEADGTPSPGLAKGWSGSSDGREWTLTLEPEARFHDGTPVGAADAVRSLRRFLRGPSAAAERLAATLAGGPAFRNATTGDLPGLSAPDGAHVVLRLTAPVPVPLAPLAAPSAAIVSATGAGAGPFVPGARAPRRLELTPFAAHVRGRPYLDRVTLIALGDRDAAQAELDTGRAQVVLGGEADAAPLAVLLLVLDPGRAPLDRAEARQALVASVDGRSLVDHLVPGGEARTALVPPMLLSPLATSAAPARVPVKGSLDLAVSRDVPPPVSQRVLACFADLGLDARVQPMDPARLPAATAGARLLWWSPEVPEAGLALRELAALAPGADRQALDAADRERDPDRRRALLHRADAALRESWTLAPLAAVPLPFRARASVHGLRAAPGGALLLADAWREP